MSTLNKPPLPSYNIITVRPVIGCIWGNSKIIKEAEQITKDRTKESLNSMNNLLNAN